MERWHRAVMQQSCKHSIEKTRRDKSVSTTLTGRRATLRQEHGSITDNHWHGHRGSAALGPAADSNCGEIGYSSYFYIKTPMKRHLIQGQWCQCQPSTPGVIAHVTASPRPGLQRGRTRCPVLTARTKRGKSDTKSDLCSASCSDAQIMGDPHAGGENIAFRNDVEFV